MRKKLLICIVAMGSICSSLFAQGNAITPEFTVRGAGTLFSSSASVSGGVRVNEKTTLGLMLGMGSTTINAVPGTYNYNRVCLYARRYHHLGEKQRFSIYNDFVVGGGMISKVTPGLEAARPEYSKGRLEPYLAWQPGIRVRIYKNLHFFVGPVIDTDSFGVHVGLGL